MKLMYQLLLMLVGLLILVSGAYYGTLWMTHDYSADFLRADRCLGLGGVYVYEESKCYLPGECEDMGGKWNGVDKKCEK